MMTVIPFLTWIQSLPSLKTLKVKKPKMEHGPLDTQETSTFNANCDHATRESHRLHPLCSSGHLTSRDHSQ